MPPIVAWVEPTSPARSGRPDDNLHETTGGASRPGMDFPGFRSAQFGLRLLHAGKNIGAELLERCAGSFRLTLKPCHRVLGHVPSEGEQNRL
jgi:hypothetical protein